MKPMKHKRAVQARPLATKDQRRLHRELQAPLPEVSLEDRLASAHKVIETQRQQIEDLERQLNDRTNIDAAVLRWQVLIPVVQEHATRLGLIGVDLQRALVLHIGK